MADDVQFVDALLALNEFDNAASEVRAVRDRLATVLAGLEAERQWLVPPSQRPTCPLDQKPCTSWTCLVDVCVDTKLAREG